MFAGVHEIMQCHQLFHMALQYRIKEWNTKDDIGDVILASVSPHRNGFILKLKHSSFEVYRIVFLEISLIHQSLFVSKQISSGSVFLVKIVHHLSACLNCIVASLKWCCCCGLWKCLSFFFISFPNQWYGMLTEVLCRISRPLWRK